MAALLNRLKKAKADILNLTKDDKKKEEEPSSTRSSRARKKLRRPTVRTHERKDNAEVSTRQKKADRKGSSEVSTRQKKADRKENAEVSTRQKKLKRRENKKPDEMKKEERTKADDDGKEKEGTKKKIAALLKKKRMGRQTITEEGGEEETHENATKDTRKSPASVDCSERRTHNEKNVSEMVKAQMAAGAIEISSDDVKTAMRNFAIRSSSLLAPGALQEYIQSVKMYIPEDTTREAFDKNPTKNRYKDVVCADRDRVVLTKGDTDYIHANHVRGAPLPDSQHFICTQGPLPATVADFWRMCRQESTSSIIMLCETKEQGKDKCFQYWAEKEGEVMKVDGTEISITTKGKFVHDGSGVTTTLLHVKEKGEPDQSILHHQWKTWPDKGVPDNFETVLKLLQLVRKHDPKTSCVVHCSAGML
uniref:Tyrosine-protein phosphatase domain-containing protein n=1 Tax=Steinernema glaseri TaxID=37863 RepID=A0A1I8A5D3_9BILA